MNLKDLAKVVSLQRQIEVLEGKLQAAADASTKITASFSLAPGRSGDGCRLENAVDDILYFEDLIEQKKALLAQRRAELRKVIETCDDPCVAAALNLRYDILPHEIQPSWTEVAMSIGGVSADSIRKACVRFLERI